MKVLGLGNALVDILVKLESDRIINELGFPKGSMQLINVNEIPLITDLINNLPVSMASGGSAANTIHGLASLGGSCGYIGKVGKDDLGRFYANDLKSIRVESMLFQSDTDTGRAYTLITPDSERTFATYLGAAVELMAADIDLSFLKKFDLLHVEGYMVQNASLIEKVLKLARNNGMKVSIDLSSFNVVEENREFLLKIIPHYVDIVFANEEEAKVYTKKEPEEALKIIASRVEIAIVKIGQKGSLIQSGNNITRITIDPVKSVDTTGAGDQYAAGFLYGYTKKLSAEQCGRLGSLLAGTVVQNIGARIPRNLWPQILKEAAHIVAN